MRARSQNKIDIAALPKEVLFNLLLMIEPHEIGTVCQSKNHRVRVICSSQMFQHAYKAKYPKKLMSGKITVSKNFNTYIFTDAKGNEIKITYIDGKIAITVYTPFKQLYPSTYIKSTSGLEYFSMDEDILRSENPLSIYIRKSGNNYNLYINRDLPSNVLNEEDERRFLNSRGLEIKEFLTYIEKSNWYSENFETPFGTGSRISLKQFNNEIINVLQDVKIGKRKVWEVINPLVFD